MKKLLMALGIWVLGAVSVGAQPLGPGASIAQIRFPAPHLAEDAATLGVKPGGFFTVKDLGADLVLLEVIGVYCPQCHKQAPGYNSLYGRLQKGKTKGRVAMFAVAAGGTDLEVAQARESMYRFPVVSDPNYVAHKALGEPLTPYTIVCRADGTIVWAHLGVVEDVSELYARIRDLLP
ncbi:hypothetical protein TDMWS_08730 [Thermodesulfomicrobium sp. WS]|uniref:peroxiredoxin family protein n=1 Tax=Thermodesulfomicrobium sp. WS TaxID=3004129 RepID=UPI00249317BC|nr:TlpA disulfide reductase family protein [Thermodesulfomicrobium sp. WS]BDV00788.1 hypothetical protein TDMWS_08730 [Thermodesulfomicrobium sp. WS]